MIMQQLWLQQINWDDVLPIPLQQDWSKMRVEMEQINNIKINRLVLGIEKIKKLELHAFADASMQAYGACMYTRATDIYGKVLINLLCAKSRVAPLKVVSLPRLELLAALLAARFMSKYAPKLQLPINEYFYWTDSRLILNWLLSPSSRWKTFVGNRVSEIQELTSVSQWRHVASSDNPADIVSRGCFPSQMKGLDLWWNGPIWLKGEHTQWPSNFQELTSKSEYFKLLRVLAYCLRVKSNFLSSDTNIYGPVEATEIENALKRLVKEAQQEEFFTELCDLKNSKLVSSKSKLFRLKPFLDNDGIIRVGGRLKHAVSLSFFQKHPIVLPADSAFTKLLFLDEHEKSLHAGPQAMLANIRLRYWPINGRNIARIISRKCVKCFKYKPVVFEPIMGDLPNDRVEPARAFVKCGVDFAGPVFVRSKLVGDLTAESFLNALRIFCDRRGYCTDVYSDNGKNFVAVNRQLREVHELLAKPEVKNELSNKGIQCSSKCDKTEELIEKPNLPQLRGKKNILTDKLAAAFDRCQCTIHWDGILFPSLSEHQLVERLPIFMSNNNIEQLLDVPKISSGSGQSQAVAIYAVLDKWGITDKVKSLCCDTTASNTVTTETKGISSMENIECTLKERSTSENDDDE
ncbi:uncharacterized protein LOC126894684 [Daktulosphaira vitifoliae]|uniref:uncharacterized protein LOC126894684 n=1 Tax=Daktulosphaira vitifoliae TaxID=58002 RepID=UPI0021AA5F6B|nr:uncharacterized protein LOC126894684 [Daktulosphaira vitifoliae]